MKQKEWTWNSARTAGVLPEEWLDLHEADLHGADLHRADLHGADLHRANLSGADLRGADLSVADLHVADLSGANLRWADLSGANLRWADLRLADLSEANIDFSCWPLWCGSLGVKADKGLAAQLAYHFCSLDCAAPEYVAARNAVLDFANQMHRGDVLRLEAITNSNNGGMTAGKETE